MVLEASPSVVEVTNKSVSHHVDESGRREALEMVHVINHKDSGNFTENQRLRTMEKSEGVIPEEPEKLGLFQFNQAKNIRLGFAMLGILLLILGRTGVPEVELKVSEDSEPVRDNVLNLLQPANTFLLKQGHEVYRNIFQLICSMLVDISCIGTFVYWVLRGTTYRLPLSLLVFYATRAVIQAIWISPFTKGYWWEAPWGIPSLVVPYGRGSDFFFSGHTGCMMIFTLEWNALKIKPVRNFVAVSAIYTMLILMIYQIHYSIDVFTGAFFADWAFTKINMNKVAIENAFGLAFKKLVWLAGRRFTKANMENTSKLNQKSDLEAPEM